MNLIQSSRSLYLSLRAEIQAPNRLSYGTTVNTYLHKNNPPLIIKNIYIMSLASRSFVGECMKSFGVQNVLKSEMAFNLNTEFNKSFYHTVLFSCCDEP
jgi:hypothetical protein